MWNPHPQQHVAVAKFVGNAFLEFSSKCPMIIDDLSCFNLLILTAVLLLCLALDHSTAAIKLGSLLQAYEANSRLEKYEEIQVCQTISNY